jgi:tetratricopeptide (TPR) repeat protein
MLLLACVLLLAPSAAAGASTPDAARYDSEEALSRYISGRLLEERGDRAAALDEYYRALFLDPGATEIARRISEVAAKMGDPARSLEFAEKALRIEPQNPRALWLKGTALLNLGRDQESLAPLEAAANADSSRVEYFRTLARVAERLDRFDLVETCYRRVVRLDDEDGEAWFQLAATEARRGQFGAADSALALAVELNPLRPGLFFLQGYVAENLGRPEAARDAYRQHLEIHPDDQGTRRRLVQVLAQQKRFAEAAREARTVAESRPGDLEALQVEADLLFEAGAADDAMRLLDRVMREHPDDIEVISMRVAVLGRHGRARTAVADAEAWLAAHPTEWRARLVAARARELNGELDRALGHLRRAVAATPDSLAPRVMLARTYESAGRLRDAERVWGEAVSRFPGVNGLVFDLATCRDRLGDFAGAEQAVRDVLAREPENATALNFLGYLFADHNQNLEEAVGLIQRALALDPDNGAYLDSLGWAFYRLGRLQEARVQLERAIQVSGGDPVIHEHLGDVYKDLQLNQLAKDQYRKSLSSDPPNSRVRAKLSRIR